jgi:SAM-dependent methyltransferase
MGSIAFDHAAEYYDRTRSLPADAQRAVIELLAGELRGRARCLEIGVGTGRIALDLMAAGIPMAGVDLARPMLQRLVEKSGGAAPFPIAVADATALPCPSATFGAAIACHVLHLIPAWMLAVEELVRVIAPGGVLLVDMGGSPTPIGREVQEHFFAHTRLQRRQRPGVDDPDLLDAALARHGMRPRLLPPVALTIQATIGSVVQRLEDGTFSGCWTLTEDERRAAAADTRAWASERYGPLDHVHTIESHVAWRAYDVPDAG